MRRPRLAVCSAIALTGVGAATAGCATQGATGSAAATRAGAAATNGSAPTPDLHHQPAIQASKVARAFAASYRRYLDGQLPASALADATPTAQTQAGAPIPAGSRAGKLALTYIRRSPHRDGFTVAYRDRAHRYPAQLALAHHTTRWQVNQVLAPDLDSILTSSRPILPAPGSTAAAMAARHFLDGYLRWLYGHAHATAIHAGSARLIAQLKQRPPRVPATLQRVAPRLVAVGTQRAPGGWLALANITAGQQTYELAVTAARSRGRWRVTRVSAAV